MIEKDTAARLAQRLASISQQQTQLWLDLARELEKAEPDGLTVESLRIKIEAIGKVKLELVSACSALITLTERPVTRINVNEP